MQVQARRFFGQEPFWNRSQPGTCRSLGLALRGILGSRRDSTGDLSHVFPGSGELTFQEFRLDLHGLLKVRCVNQFPGLFERRLHILFRERKRLPGNLRSWARN
jgi:hypothetical protein